MNADRFETFSDAYRAGLLGAVWAKPEAYVYGPDKVAEVAGKMLAAIADHPLGVNYDGEGFKRACKILSIKHTRKAILAYLDGG